MSRVLKQFQKVTENSLKIDPLFNDNKRWHLFRIGDSFITVRKGNQFMIFEIVGDVEQGYFLELSKIGAADKEPIRQAHQFPNQAAAILALNRIHAIYREMFEINLEWVIEEQGFELSDEYENWFLLANLPNFYYELDSPFDYTNLYFTLRNLNHVIFNLLTKIEKLIQNRNSLHSRESSIRIRDLDETRIIFSYIDAGDFEIKYSIELIQHEDLDLYSLDFDLTNDIGDHANYTGMTLWPDEVVKFENRMKKLVKIYEKSFINKIEDLGF